MDQLRQLYRAAFRHREIIGQKAEYRIRHAHLLHLRVRSQTRLVADDAAATRDLALLDRFLDRIRIFPIHLRIFVGDFGRIVRLQFAAFQMLGETADGVFV
jgi:hypothetical protein